MAQLLLHVVVLLSLVNFVLEWAGLRKHPTRLTLLQSSAVPSTKTTVSFCLMCSSHSRYVRSIVSLGCKKAEQHRRALRAMYQLFVG